MSETPRLSIKYEMDDVTSDGTMPPFRRDFSRQFRPGLAHYFADGVEISYEEFCRLEAQQRCPNCGSHGTIENGECQWCSVPGLKTPPSSGAAQ